MKNPSVSPTIGINRSGLVCARRPVISPTVDNFVIGKRSDMRLDHISVDHWPVVLPVLSDAAMLQSLDGIMSRLRRQEMTVMASTQAVGWDSVNGVITSGRLEDFFDYRGDQPGRRLFVAEPLHDGLPPLHEDDPGRLSGRSPRAAPPRTMTEDALNSVTGFDVVSSQ